MGCHEIEARIDQQIEEAVEELSTYVDAEIAERVRLAVEERLAGAVVFLPRTRAGRFLARLLAAL